MAAYADGVVSVATRAMIGMTAYANAAARHGTTGSTPRMSLSIHAPGVEAVSIWIPAMGMTATRPALR